MLAVNFSSDMLGSHPDDLSVSVLAFLRTSPYWSNSDHRGFTMAHHGPPMSCCYFERKKSSSLKTKVTGTWWYGGGRMWLHVSDGAIMRTAAPSDGRACRQQGCEGKRAAWYQGCIKTYSTENKEAVNNQRACLHIVACKDKNTSIQILVWWHQVHSIPWSLPNISCFHTISAMMHLITNCQNQQHNRPSHFLKWLKSKTFSIPKACTNLWLMYFFHVISNKDKDYLILFQSTDSHLRTRGQIGFNDGFTAKWPGSMKAISHPTQKLNANLSHYWEW